MKHHDHYHCPMCSAEFSSKGELDKHEQRWHTQHGISAAPPGDAPDATPPAREEVRKDRSFTRRHPE